MANQRMKLTAYRHWKQSVFEQFAVIVESYDSASNLRFDKNAIILRFDSRFDSASNHNTNLIFCFQIKIRFDIRFDVFKN